MVSVRTQPLCRELDKTGASLLQMVIEPLCAVFIPPLS